MIIDSYSDQYQGDVVSLVENFHSESLSQYDGRFSHKALAETIVNIHSSGSAESFLLIDNGTAQGILAGIGISSMFSGEKIFQELIWYINPQYRKYGGALYRTAERTLKAKGFSSIIMAVLENSMTDRIKRFYSSLGYEHFETHYIKKL